MSFDVVIAGAGPAGASAAIQLARAGRRVLLCDRSRFPRDKACGDGLIADSIAALRTLGLDRAVADAAYRTTELLTISPGGTEVRFSSTFWVLPRRTLDDLLFRAAIDAGAQFEQISVDGPILEHGRVTGVTGKRAGSQEPVSFRAPLTMLATGGAAGVLRKFDEHARSDASGIAIRAYTRPVRPAISELIISLERDLLPGYAWAFPAPDGLLNVGVGALRGRGLGNDDLNLRQRMDAFLAGKGVLGGMLGPQQAVAPYQGAPLRTGLTGARMSRPGLVIVGEAAGTTYSLTGEGIGKAMESAMLAAELAIEASPDALSDIGPRYAELMRTRYAARFKTYDIAQRWASFPFISDYIARRANRSQWVHDRLTRVITEQALPTHVFSARTIWRLITHS
jgi:geranylgeranyl reductase family protein